MQSIHPKRRNKDRKGSSFQKHDSRKKTAELKRRECNQVGQTRVTDALWDGSSGGHAVLARFDAWLTRHDTTLSKISGECFLADHRNHSYNAFNNGGQ